MTLNLSSSLEDYLEAILNINDNTGRVRVTDISQNLNVEKSSVNFAINKLKDLNLVTHVRYEDIKLTADGEAEAKKIRDRHDLLFKFFHNFLGITPKESKTDACRVEHSVSSVTINRLSKFVSYLESNSLFNKNDFLTFLNEQEK